MITFGPQRLKEKDQVFLYVHRNLRIKDTKISNPGYHQVSADIKYPVKQFFLRTQQEVEHFWLEVESTCVCTPLGMAQSILGQTIELQNLYKKPAMIEACKNREFGEEKDDGTVPGDQLGAAGFDSALFAHLKRNWSPAEQIPAKVNTSIKENKKPSPNGAKPFQRLLSYLDRASKNTGIYYPKEPDSKPLAVPVVKGATKVVEHQPKKKVMQRKKSDITLRVVKPRKLCSARKPYYDDKDQAALKAMKTMRVSWSSQEDIVLLMCKVCSWFLDRHLDKMVVPFTVVRDILNERFPELSKDKTSRACQRRMRFMLLNPATKANALVFLCEAQHDQELMEMFYGPKPVKSDEKQWVTMFRTVLNHLMKKFSKSSEERHREVTLPTSIGELKNRYEVVVPGHAEVDSWSFAEPQNLVDIHFSSVAMVILASIAADDGKSNWSLTLYKIYEQYPDNLIRSVTARLRHNGIICKKHPNTKKLYISLNLSMLPFTLSNKFKFEMARRYTPEHIASMGKLMLELLAKRQSGESYTFEDDIEPAYAPLLFTLLLSKKLGYSMEVPEAIVDFDSSMTHGKVPLLNEELGEDEDNDSQGEDIFENSDTLATKAKSLNFATSGGNVKTSRSFLYMLKHNMKKVLRFNTLRPQDYAIVKSCKVDFFLTSEDLVPGWTLEEPTDKSYALKVRNPLYDKIVQEQRVCYSLDTANHCWTAESITDAYRQAAKSLEEAQIGAEIYSVILKKEQLGITYAQLYDTFCSTMRSVTLESHLDFLVEREMILRVGVTCLRFVALQHSKPWVIRSFKIPKEMRAYTSALGEQEHALKVKMRKRVPAKDAARIPVLVATIDTKSNQGMQGCRRARDSNSSCLKRTYYEAITKNINVDAFEKIMYVPRIWRKPDGTLNRPAFLQLLSAILSYILDHPGVREEDFKSKFSRKMEPCVQMLELLRILESLGCIKRFFMRPDTTTRCSLFSKRRQVITSDTYCTGDVVCYTGTLDALVNFAAFAVYFQK
ncbi:hypothetical protein MRX96_023763 [Rhipicephalus microplus]